MDEFVSSVRGTSPRFNRINAIRPEYNMVAMSIIRWENIISCRSSLEASHVRIDCQSKEARPLSAVSSQVVLHITFLLVERQQFNLNTCCPVQRTSRLQKNVRRSHNDWNSMSLSRFLKNKSPNWKSFHNSLYD